MATALREAGLPDRVRLPFAFDPAGLADDLALLGDAEWIAHFVPQNYEGEWGALPLRAKAGATHPVMMIYSDPEATEFEDTALLGQLPHIAAVVAAFRCPVRAVRLMRLTPGSVIKEHRDHDLAAEFGMARIHVPIATNPGVEFLVNRAPVAMAPGEAWYLRLSDPHAVANRGESDRIHLVIDVLVDGWLAAQLESGAAGA
ncbi:MAG: aspartyl/asparaginyl beta-hydroxylase domain-containing protein [Sphingomonas sp.]|uniref:aspartyl/asparaginyl beta-hydroxylase domain-containing protein n=1 Tax=Sphingomonas sp. TaxID=28214 RepID=UPI0025FA2E0E|nr:aspartyl/asparaginyl beta-hydroxylase domain-containing protein [Sphingomonas sp.]MBX3563208.1 aspartyl/asparaginyl beta-hydroxylase domain-containing protein [Sphingomonas sp.]